MKVLFLDIDGVINSTRTCYAFDGYPHSFEPDQMAMFDPVAIKLIQELCKTTNAVVVVSSTWRILFTCDEIQKALGIPVFDRTVDLSTPDKLRGDEIQIWLDEHPEVTRYAIVDDNSDMLESQMSRFVQTDPDVGLSFQDYIALVSLLTD